MRRRPAAPKIVRRAFTIATLISLFAALLNREIVPIFGKPFTYQWLYYSDFLQGQDAKNAVRYLLNLRLVLFWVAMLVGFLAAAWVLRRVFGGLLRRIRPHRLLSLGAAGLAAYFLAGGAYLSHAGSDWNRSRLGSPIVVFAESVVAAPQISPLLTLPTDAGTQDFAPPPPAPVPSAVLSGEYAGQTRNVILVVLETTPAGMLELYGGKYGVTPELSRAGAQAAIFTNIYAHSPSTETSVASILLSLYPWLSYRAITRDHSALPSPSLSSELRREGFRTGVFNSSDLRYAGTGEFFSHRGFDDIVGYSDLRCEAPALLDHNRAWETYLDGVDDACTMRSLLDWVARSAPQPFFGMLWTMMTHMPYFPPEPQESLESSNEALNRYLNALKHDDQSVGRLLRFLEERHLAESTLVVVVGDHGESFGRHGHVGHGSKIYDEDVHVPLLFIQPGRFHGERIHTVGGLIDIAPTILDVLGHRPPAEWQGRSLFRGDRTDRTYFFAPHSNYYLGLREGNFYFIDNVWQSRFEVYDMSKDPLQDHDLAAEMPAQVRQAEQRLAAWVQYQDRLYRDLFAREASPGPTTPHPAN